MPSYDPTDGEIVAGCDSEIFATPDFPDDGSPFADLPQDGDDTLFADPADTLFSANEPF